MNSDECLLAIKKVLDEAEPDDPQVGEGVDLYKIDDIVGEWAGPATDLAMAKLVVVSAAKNAHSDAVMKWIVDNRGPQGELPLNGFPDYMPILLALLKDEEQG